MLESDREDDPAMRAMMHSETSKTSMGSAVPFKQLLYALQQLYILKGDPEFLTRAVETADIAIRLNPDDPVSRAHRAWCLFELFQVSRRPELLDASERSYQQALKRAPFNVTALANLARIERDRGNRNEEIKYLERLLELEPHDLTARLMLVRTFLEEGRTEPAKQQMRIFVEKRREIQERQKQNPRAFATSYRQTRIHVDDSELFAIRQLFISAESEGESE